jgi:hypothetical protein
VTPSTATPATIDLRSGERRTRVRLDAEPDVLATLSAEERVRLLVRVLCELVAYDASGRGAGEAR